MKEALAISLWLLSLMLAVARAQDVHGPPAALAHGAAAARKSALSLFTHSKNCVGCHNNLTTPGGEDVSIGSTWRSTMMANSARDPYWQAGVRRETIDHPSHAVEIQDECAACHMPMAQKIARASGGTAEVFAHLPTARPNRSILQALASDGVSCSVCHQIAADGLGTRDSFNANFRLKATPADGARVIFGPHRVDAGRKTIMRSVTGFVQAEAPHVKQSELCASCHTLITTAYGPRGEVVGSLPEQMNYQEWQHSDFNKEGRACQSCHMPMASGPIRAASVLGDARDTLATHVFVGGNAHMIRLLNRYRTELGVAALPAELEATARATVRQLERDTASIAVSTPRLSEHTLSFAVEVRNLTGHKFPTGYPSRRTWLHATVRDERGRIVFESGAINDAGAIAGNDGDLDPLAFEPHYGHITRPDQVQIYETILGDPRGLPTTGLLAATRYLKDNRLLPRGFDKATADPEIAVYGDATRDEDFSGGGDRVHYAIEVAGAGPYTVDIELRYQSIAYRWAHNLRGYDAPEPKRFVTYYEATSAGSSIVVATASARTAFESQ
jgi:mono/diheme cytochrome c family protein